MPSPIRSRTILGGAVRRVLPASLLAGGVGLLLSDLVLGRPAWAPSLYALVPVATGVGIALGFGLALAALRPRLTPDADVAGRRATVLGACGWVASFAASFVLRPGTLGLSLFIGVALGVLLTSVLFLPWVARAPHASNVHERA